MPKQFREGLKAKLLCDVLRQGGKIRLRVLGTSMLPSLWPGDHAIIEYKPVEKLRRGDIVLCQIGDAFVIHRLVWARGDRLVTRGDAMPQVDPTIQRSDLLGRVIQIQRNGKMITPPRSIGVFTKTLGWTLCHSDRCRGLALRIHSLQERKFATSVTHSPQSLSNS